jgi:hypothetical protein
MPSGDACSIFREDPFAEVQHSADDGDEDSPGILSIDHRYPELRSNGATPASELGVMDESKQLIRGLLGDGQSGP